MLPMSRISFYRCAYDVMADDMDMWRMANTLGLVTFTIPWLYLPVSDDVIHVDG